MGSFVARKIHVTRREVNIFGIVVDSWAGVRWTRGNELPTAKYAALLSNAVGLPGSIGAMLMPGNRGEVTFALPRLLPQIRHALHRVFG